MKHSHKWIKTLMESLEELVDEEAKVKVLENCGRNCISRSMIKKAQKCYENAKNIDDFLDKLSQVWRHLQRDKDEVYIVYPKCYCSLVKDYPGKLSPFFCNCSRGWIKELFESALKRPVDVELEKSIRQGDDICRFKVHL